MELHAANSKIAIDPTFKMWGSWSAYNAGFGDCAFWFVQLARNASRESVVKCLIMCQEAPFYDGGHVGRVGSMSQ